AEDGIRDFHVTGVQTCALPICRRGASGGAGRAGPCLASRATPLVGGGHLCRRVRFTSPSMAQASATGPRWPSLSGLITERMVWRSEERRVGKGCRERASEE